MKMSPNRERNESLNAAIAAFDSVRSRQQCMQQFAGNFCVVLLDSCLSGGKAIDLFKRKWNRGSRRKRRWYQRFGDCRDQVVDSFTIQRAYKMRLADCRSRMAELLEELRTPRHRAQVDLVD